MSRHKLKSAIAAAGTWTSLLILLLHGCCQVPVSCRRREVQAPNYKELLEDKIEGPGSFNVTEGVRPSRMLGITSTWNRYNGQLM